MYDRARIIVLPASAIVLVVFTAGCGEFTSADSGDESRSQAKRRTVAVNHPALPAKSRFTNWPRFRGPNGAGASADKGLPTEWSATKNIVWKTPLPGPGASSPVTWGDRVYVTCYSGYGLSKESPGDAKKLQRHLVCINRADGRIVWDKVLPAKAMQLEYRGFITTHGYASSTPTVDETGVYVFYGTTGLAKYTHAGALRWRTACGHFVDGFGTAASPILHRDLVIIHADVEARALIALNKSDGKEKWRVATNVPRGHCRGTPVLVTVGKARELVFFAGDGKLAAVDPATGRSLWSCETKIEKYVNPSPIARGDVVYMVADYPGQAVAVRAGGRGDVTGTHKLWEVRKGSEMNTPVYHDGHLYWIDQSGIARCLDAKTGRQVYESRLRPSAEKVYASGVLADGKLYFVSREKGTYVLQAGPEFKQRAHNVIATDTSIFNATPAISRGQLLIRSDRFLYCIGR